MTYLGLAALSAAVLLLELTLTRIYSVAQGYHFAFLAVSLGLLGFGASGTALFVAPSGWRKHGSAVLSASALLFGATALGAYWALNVIPFDSYRLMLEPAMFLYMALFYLVQVVPFFFGGLALGAALTLDPRRAGALYGAGLVGAGVGALLALGWTASGGPVGALAGVAVLGAVAWIAFTAGSGARRVAVTAVGVIVLVAAGVALPRFVELEISPYKSLPQLLLQQGSQLEETRWNAFSRVDQISSSAFHQAPGLSFAYTAPLPPQTALITDADNPTMVTAVAPEEAAFTEYLPTAIAYELVDRPRVLIIEPGGGLDVLSAIHHEARSVVAVASNPLEAEALRSGFNSVDPDVLEVVASNPRGYVDRVEASQDLIVVSLREAFRPITAGAYSLAENHLYTKEAFRSYFEGLAPGGLLMATRWVQVPPSEELRMAATAIEALEESGVAAPGEGIAAIRTLQTLTLLVKKEPFTSAQLEAVKGAARSLQMDISYLPGLDPSETNRYFVLPDEIYYDGIREILDPAARDGYYASQAFDVTPATDDHPFFFHFFRWSQFSDVIDRFGKAWEPFGGAGFLVVLLFLGLAVVVSAVLIVVPLAVRRVFVRRRDGPPANISGVATLAYFLLLGLAFLWVELPLMQRFILLLDHPTYSFGVVLFAVLVFSGLGSMASSRLGAYRMWAVALLGPVVLIYAVAPIPPLGAVLGLPLTARGVIAVVSIAPIAFLMGMPLPAGIAAVESRRPEMIPWAWGVNGYASVVGAVLAAVISLSWGFSRVMLLAGAGYILAAAVLILVLRDRRPAERTARRPG